MLPERHTNVGFEILISPIPHSINYRGGGGGGGGLVLVRDYGIVQVDGWRLH